MSPGARHRAGPAAQVLAGRARHKVPSIYLISTYLSIYHISIFLSIYRVPSRPQRVPGRQLQTSHTEPLIFTILYIQNIFWKKHCYQYLSQSAEDTH